MMTVHVRYLDPRSDLDALISFMPELYESNFPGFVADPAFLARKRAQLREAVHDPGQTVLVAVDEAGVCGFIWLIVEVEWAGTRRGEVSAVYVAPRARRRGVGRHLMQEAEQLLIEQGCRLVHLMVTASNERAVNMYRELGFRVTRHQMEKEL
jgi:ribosomal protein S18 acetylase RimI-like enzyme